MGFDSSASCKEKKMGENPNSNCLEGMSCPQCGQHERFRIVAEATFEVTDDGTHDYNDVNWYGNSHVSCPECEWYGLAKELHKESRSEETIH